MQTNRRLALQLLTTVLVVLAAGFCLPLFSTVAVRTPMTKNLSNAKQLATGCQLYAADHAGRFPIHLSELQLDYIVNVNSLRYTTVDKGNGPKPELVWLYFGAGFDETNPPRILIASPQASTTDKKQQRIVMESDGSGAVRNEPEYQQMLTETIRQMRALDDSRHPGKSTPTDTPAK
ncbi:MAG: hypothetical protein P4L99_01995 [Chthoniobacter sp.]|nr:hypothetical protein [Chthoniobacter sp.]